MCFEIRNPGELYVPIRPTLDSGEDCAMATQSPARRDGDAKTFLEPALGELSLPSHIEREVRQRLEEGEYVEALVTAIYFD